MSEEKPTFKITDRRLFNPDGSPREVAPEEAAPKTEAAASSVIEFPGAAANAATPTSSAASAAATSHPAPPPAAQAATQPEGEAPDTGDPTAFVNLLMFIAQPAAAALGISDHPAAVGGEIDLPLAKHCIDLLGTMREKTRGNLSSQEQQILEGLLAELRMQFVAVSGQRMPSPGQTRGFTGSDITGGR